MSNDIFVELINFLLLCCRRNSRSLDWRQRSDPEWGDQLSAETVVDPGHDESENRQETVEHGHKSRQGIDECCQDAGGVCQDDVESHQDAVDEVQGMEREEEDEPCLPAEKSEESEALREGCKESREWGADSSRKLIMLIMCLFYVPYNVAIF